MRNSLEEEVICGTGSGAHRKRPHVIPVVEEEVREVFRREACVAVVGLGKIGLPLAVQYARHGWRVLGCDCNPRVVETVNAGCSHVEEEAELAAEVPKLVGTGLLSATVDTTGAVRRSAVVVVIVPVAIDARLEVTFEALDAATMAIGKGLQPGTLVIYETTLPVGTTARRLRQTLEHESRLRAGHDFHLAYSPERVSSGSIFHDLRAYPKVVGGLSTRCREAAIAFYRSSLEADIIAMGSTDEAEFVKLIETTYRDVNIALANEFACYADVHGLDAATAIAAANTQPYSHIHAPGPGVGGHCIPVYPYFLLSSAQGSDPGKPHPLELPRQARRINDAMAHYAVWRVEAAIGPLEQRSVLILGVAYRADVREPAFTSAALLQQALLERGAVVYVDDPLFSEHELRALGYTFLTPEHEGEIDAIVLQAGHQAYHLLDFARFTRCRVVLDGRRALHRSQVESLGMRYLCIGDGNRSRQGSSEEQQHQGSLAFQQEGL